MYDYDVYTMAGTAGPCGLCTTLPGAVLCGRCQISVRYRINRHSRFEEKFSLTNDNLSIHYGESHEIIFGRTWDQRMVFARLMDVTNGVMVDGGD